MLVLYGIYILTLAPDRSLALIFSLIVIGGGVDLTWFLYGLEEFKTTSIRDIFIKISTAVCIFIFVKEIDDVWKYALIYSAGFLISQLIVLPLICGKITFVKVSVNDIRAHIKPNLILFLPTVAVSIYRTMDKIMLGGLSSSVELGYYHNCENIVRVPLAFISALGTIMLPRMSNMLAKNTDKGKMENIFDKSIAFAMFVSTSICFGMMAVAIEFVPLFYGPGFEKCVALFYIILPSCVFVAFANVIRTQFLLPRKMDKVFIVSLFSGAIVNFILNLVLIPSYDSIGASFGTLAAETVVFVVQAACVFKEANIGRNIKNSIPFIISGVTMFLVFRDVSFATGNIFFSLLLKILVSGAFYLLILAAFMGLNRSGKKR